MPRPALLSPTSPQLLLRRQQQRQQQWRSARHAARSFQTSAARYNNVPNHYETLELSHNASAADVKRQFYSLSKKHHPDRNRGDPSASHRFVQISEAYHVLGSPEKRARYDRDFHRAHAAHHAHHHHHSHHHAPSYAGPAGSRPASGLSRRRTQFRGPPPSFYRNGGWGAQSAKRSSHQPGGNDSSDFEYGAGPETASSSSSSTWNAAAGPDGTGGGFGPGQATRGWDAHIPHWDRTGHARTQEGIAASVAQSRWRRGVDHAEDLGHRGGGWSLLLNFVVVSSAIAAVASVPSLFGTNRKKQKV